MHEYLTREGLERALASYRNQAKMAETLNDVRLAEGAALAIQYLLDECYPPEPVVGQSGPCLVTGESGAELAVVGGDG